MVDADLAKVRASMISEGLPEAFVTNVCGAASEFEGVHDFAIMWFEESDPEERAEIVGDLCDLVSLCVGPPLASRPEYAVCIVLE